MMTNVSMDTIKFLSQIVLGIEDDVDDAYTGQYLCDDRAHSSLQRIDGKVKTLKAFLSALEAPNASTTDSSEQTV